MGIWNYVGNLELRSNITTLISLCVHKGTYGSKAPPLQGPLFWSSFYPIHIVTVKFEFTFLYFFIQSQYFYHSFMTHFVSIQSQNMLFLLNQPLLRQSQHNRKKRERNTHQSENSHNQLIYTFYIFIHIN